MSISEEQHSQVALVLRVEPLNPVGQSAVRRGGPWWQPDVNCRAGSSLLCGSTQVALSHGQG